MDHANKYHQIKRMKEIEREKKFRNMERQRKINKKRFYESSFHKNIIQKEKKEKY